jgi:hypothetical protein
MRRTLGHLTAAALACVALGLTAGCGSDSSSTANDPGRSQASEPAGHPSRTPGPVEGAKVLPLISMTGAGGRVESTATPLNSEADLRAFGRQLRIPAMWHRIDSEVGDRLGMPGHEVVGQIVAVGWDRPPGADVVVTQEGDVAIVPHEVASPLQECLAAVTTVAIAVLPRS